MTRKDYILIATAIAQAMAETVDKKYTAAETIGLVTDHIAHALQADNSLFNTKRFKEFIGKQFSLQGECGGKETQKVTIYTYDVWGNARDGFEVNDKYRHGSFMIPNNMLDTKPGVLDFLNANFFSKKVSASKIDIDLSDEHTTYVNQASNGKPLLEIISEYATEAA